MSRLLVLIVAALAPVAGRAEVFRCMDANGKVTYSLTRPAGPCHAPRAALKVSMKTTATKAPADFPHVDLSTQSARDDKRRQILEAELETELQLLASADGADAERHDRNVQALRKEISFIR